MGAWRTKWTLELAIRDIVIGSARRRLSVDHDDHSRIARSGDVDAARYAALCRDPGYGS
jgi:hypothetical protein